MVAEEEMIATVLDKGKWIGQSFTVKVLINGVKKPFPLSYDNCRELLLAWGRTYEWVGKEAEVEGTYLKPL